MAAPAAGLDLNTYLAGKEGHHQELVQRWGASAEAGQYNPVYRQMARELQDRRGKGKGKGKVRARRDAAAPWWLSAAAGGDAARGGPAMGLRRGPAAPCLHWRTDPAQHVCRVGLVLAGALPGPASVRPPAAPRGAAPRSARPSPLC